MRDRKSDAHRKVANAKKGEVVHHRDDNKDNNAPGNLEKMTARAHNKHTASQTRNHRRLVAALNMPAKKEKLY